MLSKVRFLALIFSIGLLFGCSTTTPPSAPYNLKWGMTFDDAKKLPIHSLTDSRTAWSGMEKGLIVGDVSPTELKETDFAYISLNFSPKKGLNQITLTSFKPYSPLAPPQEYETNKHSLALYNKISRQLNEEYGPPIKVVETVTDKANFQKSLSDCHKKEQEACNSGCEDITWPLENCAKWYREYQKGKVHVILEIDYLYIKLIYYYDPIIE